MSVKKIPLKSARQKRLMGKTQTNKNKMVDHSLDLNLARNDEAAIVRQFHRIQKGYSRLMNDVAKELDLVKSWIGSQASLKRNDLKARLSSRLTKS
jgi:hypothetical protein